MALGAFRRLTVLSVFAALGAVSACKGGGKTSTTPEPSQADAEKNLVDAKKAAKANALIDFANRDLASGRYVSAGSRAEEALASNPSNADAHAILGAARWRAGDAAGSTESYQKAVEIDPTNFGAVLGLGRNLQALGRHNDAAELQVALLKDDPSQVDPLIVQLWSYYALADAEAAVRVVDQVFKLLPADDPQLPLIQATAAFIRPFLEQGPLCAVEGESGTAELGFIAGIKSTRASVGKITTDVLLFENREEAVIDPVLAKRLKLEELGRFKPVTLDGEIGVALIPELDFGGFKLKNVPARIESLAPYEPVMGTTPGIMLGRQALQAVGALSMDFAAGTVTFTKEPPASPPEGATAVPLLLGTNHVQHVPAIPVSIDGADHLFYAYLGGMYQSGATVTQKHYFKSGHRPRDVEAPEDPDNGLKMVYVSELKLGDQPFGGTGGLVLVNDPPDPNLAAFVTNTGFELGGYINAALMATWRLTYSLSQGRVYIQSPMSAAPDVAAAEG